MDLNKKKWVLLLLVFIMIVSMAAGCSTSDGTVQNDDAPEESAAAVQESDAAAEETDAPAEETSPDGMNLTGYPIAKEMITLKMMGAKNVLHGEWNDMLLFKEYEKKTNIHIEWTTVPQETFAERRNIVLATNDLPDVFYRGLLNPADEVNYGSQGIFIPLNDLIDKYAPNIKAMFERFPDVEKSITAPDGNIYTLPQAIDYLLPRVNTKPYINKKWLDQVNLSVPTTTEEYYQVLKAFKEKDPNGNGKPDEIPWSGNKFFLIMNAMRGAWGLGTAGGKIENFDLDSAGNVRFYPTDIRYKEMLEYFAKLYAEGLLDKEVFSQEQAQFLAKGAQDVVGSFHLNHVSQIGSATQDDFVGLPALKGPHGDQIYSQVLPVTSVTGTFAITRNNQYPEATIRWVDYFYSEEGSKFFRMGVEGVTYETLPDGKFQYTEEINKNPNGLSQPQAIGQFSPWPGGGLPHMIFEKNEPAGTILPSDLVVSETTKQLEPYLPKEIWPGFLFTKEEQDRLNALESDILTYVNEMKVKFILGTEPFSSWDNYVSTISQMGVDDLRQIYQNAYDRWKK